jgi:hypothetical protein
MFESPLPETEYVHTQNHLVIIDVWQNIFKVKHLKVYVLPKGEFIGQSENQMAYKFPYDFLKDPLALAERALRVYMVDMGRIIQH